MDELFKVKENLHEVFFMTPLIVKDWKALSYKGLAKNIVT